MVILAVLVHLTRFVHFLLVGLLALSALHTSVDVFILPVLRLSNSLPRWAFLPDGLSRPYKRVAEGVEVTWPSSELNSLLGSDSTVSHVMSENLFLSKAFSNSMRPTRIIPYLYRASGNFDEDDITVTTLITLDRFPVFARMVNRYRGPVSVTVHSKNTTSNVQELLTELHTLYSSSPVMSTFVDVHLVIDSFSRQFNTWRNLARLYARTKYVMMLDIDFYLCTDFRKSIRSSKAAMAKLEEGLAAFVVPAFEYLDHEEGSDFESFPQDKKSLLSLVNEGKIASFHAMWTVGHNSTNYERFYKSSPSEVYKVTQYQSAYEPYVIFKKDGPPWCEERFVGYGGNKAACLFEMYLSGIPFYVLSDHFIIHQSHEYEEVARTNERKFNKRVYAEFKFEICLRYLRTFDYNWQLNTTRGWNLLDECSKIEGFSRIAAKLLQD